MLTAMSQDRTIAIAVAAVPAVVIGVTIAMYVINPFNTTSDDARARILGFTLYRAPSHSMEPIFRAGSYFVVSAIALRGRDPRVGEIVAYRFPPQPASSTMELREDDIYPDLAPLAAPRDHFFGIHSTD